MERLEVGDGEELLQELGSKYLWWKPENGGPHPAERVIAQVMNVGTYDDIRRLERAFDADKLRDVLANAQPGWFSPRSWDFWRGRLSHSTKRKLQEPPRRSFDVRRS